MLLFQFMFTRNFFVLKVPTTIDIRTRPQKKLFTQITRNFQDVFIKIISRGMQLLKMIEPKIRLSQPNIKNT